MYSCYHYITKVEERSDCLTRPMELNTSLFIIVVSVIYLVAKSPTERDENREYIEDGALNDLLVPTYSRHFSF